MQARRPAEISVDHGLQSHALAVVAPRSSSLPMGSSSSKPAEPSVAARVRRAFAGRRKKEKDIDLQSLSSSVPGSRPAHSIEIARSSASSPPQFQQSPAPPPEVRTRYQPSPSAPNKGPAPDALRPLPPPPPPPKPTSEPTPAPPAPVTQRPPLPAVPAPNRTSIMPVSPGIESALTYMSLSDQLQQQQHQAADTPLLPSPPANTYPGPVQPSRPTSDAHPLPEKPLIQGSARAQDPDRTPLQVDVEEARRIERPRAKSDSEGVFLDREHADKRKSDSTISHCTIRPGAGGPRTSRPVSMAESFQSTYTIVPGNGSTSVGVVMVNKRLSAVDVDLSLLEEDDDSQPSLHDSDDHRDSMVIVRPEEKLSSPSLRQKRRSMSLNIGVGGNTSQSKLQIQHPPPSASAAELKQPSYSISEGFYNHPTSTSSSLATSFSTQPQQAWTPNRLPPNRNQRLPAVPPHVNTSFTYPTQRPLPSHPPPPASFRQTAVSISSSLAPAAGLARKAVEKVKAWGHMGHHSGSTSGSFSGASMSSGYSSSASVNSYPNEMGMLVRTPSNQSSAATHTTHSSSMHAVNIKEIRDRSERERQQQAAALKKKDKKKRTPNGPSGTYSIGSVSTTSGSDSDAFMSPGPHLGVLLRGPLRNRNGAPAASGVVFGRELSRCVIDTAVWAGREDVGVERELSGRELMGRPELKIYERRMLPAVVVRCTQHILIWGVQEEGLFRVPGRAAHIAKLKSEFDTGVDYDMSGCTPGDLDPHAVASVFRAYLRDLPEHILTQKLSHYFDAAIEQETAAAPSVDHSTSQLGMRKGIGLPTSPKPIPHHNPSGSMSGALPSMSGYAFPAPNLRKPPSLSTFAIPSFTGARPISNNLIAALRSLISRLPKENRDLLRTVIELVKATDKESKTTKMPLSNLIMVFLPSLNISAQLLRVLCENESVWSGLVDTSEPDSESEDEVFAEAEQPDEDGDEDDVLDVRRDTVILDIRRNDDDQQTPKADREAPANEGEESDEDKGDDADAHRRWTVIDRPEIPTVYLDSRSQASSASLASSSNLPLSSQDASTTESSVLQDDLSSVSASTGGDDTGMLSSSVESVLTPSTSSAHSSAAYLPLDALDTVKDLSGRTGGSDNAHNVSGPGPRIHVVEPAPLGLEIGLGKEEGKVRRLAISNPLPYPSGSTPPPVTPLTATSEKSVPKSPISPKRRSIPTLSFPSLSFGHRNSHGSAGSEPPSPAEPSLSSGKGLNVGLRTKKPSLKLLFSKKSAGSLNSMTKETSSAPGSTPSSTGSHSLASQQLRTASPMLTAHGSASGCDGSCSSDSSVSTPVSAVTAPGMGSGPSSSVVELPPVLGASFEEGSSLRRELGLEESPPGTATPARQQEQERGKKERIKTMIGQTPIADWYSAKSAASSVADLPSTGTQKHHVDERVSVDDDEYEYDVAARRRTVLGRQRGPLVSSSLSLNHLGLDDDELAGEDWTRSVMLAAEMELSLDKKA